MKYMLFYKGPATPPNASHEGWRDWFTGLGDALVDQGSPIVPRGLVMHNDGSTTESEASLNGYSVISAESKDEALDLIKDHPYLRLGTDYTIEVFERER
ncbi:MAG TPA: hypothetical protein VJQ08_01430 [Candidatus Dormibacteraeota bacterium]|nr:hypothetical protein [Candidatus Dormibacteraeota bacterium]